jgi:hypothetical protein
VEAALGHGSKPLETDLPDIALTSHNGTEIN